MTSTATGDRPIDHRPIDAREVRRAIEYYYEHGFTDGLPVVPPTESYVAEFLAQVGRSPDEVVAVMAHLNRECTVHVAAVNSIMAGCLPEYFPVVLGILDALRADTGARGATRFSSGLWQSTTGTVPITVVNGPVRHRLGFNSGGNVFGPGFRPNATIGRALRLIAMNALGLTPQVLDQSTHSNPAKYTCCIAENEEESPWASLSADAGYGPEASTVSLMMMRSCMHIESRSGTRPEHLLDDVANSVARTGTLYSEMSSCLVVVSPEHAALLASHGWGKQDVREYLAAHAVCTRAAMERAGKTGISRDMHWLVPRDHPDALPGEEPRFERRDGTDVHRVLGSPDDVVVVVAGAANAGVSSVVDLMGAPSSPSGRGGGRTPAISEIVSSGAEERG
ncbi:MAG: hypothetical protein ACRDWE_05155 [Acidimicrobiales bacterium]